MSRTADLGTRVGPYDSSRPLRQDDPCWAAIRSVQGFLLTSHLWLCEHFISLAAPPALPEADLINLVADWHKWRTIAFLITEDPSLPAPLQTKCRDLWCCRIWNVMIRVLLLDTRVGGSWWLTAQLRFVYETNGVLCEVLAYLWMYY